MLERFSAPGDFFVANVSVSTWKQVFVIMNTFNTTLGKHGLCNRTAPSSYRDEYLDNVQDQPSVCHTLVIMCATFWDLGHNTPTTGLQWAR